MALTDSDGNSYQDMADYHMQVAESNQTASDKSTFNKVISKESSWKGERTGSNVGLGQWGKPELKEFGITNPMDPEQNYRAMGMEKARNERYLSQHGYEGKLDTAGKIGLMHQQGIGGGTAIMMADPNTTMGEALSPFYKDKKLLGQAISQNAGWGDVNTPVGEWRERAKAFYEGGSPIPHLQSTLGRPHIDREHDVPLLAAGLMGKDGDLYGTAIDRRIPHQMDLEDDAGNKATIDSSQFVHLHEMAEIEHMEGNLLPGGMKSSEAYTKAHNEVATPREQAAVEKWASEHGLEPTSSWKNYQKFWSNQLKTSHREPEKVHPDTYLHPYDGHEFQKQMEEKSGRTIADHPKLASNEKKMDDLSKGLEKDLNPYKGLLDLMEEEEQSHGPMPKVGPERQAWLKSMMNDPRARQIGDEAGSLGGIMGAPKAAGFMAKFMGATETQRAERMEKAGLHPDEIREQTGLHRGADQKWREEISDVTSKWLGGKDTPEVHTDQAGDYFHLNDLFQHKELYDRYPTLKNVKVRIEPSTPGTLAHAGGDEVTLNTRDLQKYKERSGMDDSSFNSFLHSILLHELQHVVQDFEGMGAGGGAEWGARDLTAYHRSAGEVEARNVQTRWVAAINERLNIKDLHEEPKGWTSVGTKTSVDDLSHHLHPEETEDVPRSKQGVSFYDPRHRMSEKVQGALKKRVRGASDIYRR